MKNHFAENVAKLEDKQLVYTYQFVSGQFATQMEKMSPSLNETANDMNILKHEILKRLTNNLNTIKEEHEN